MVFINIYTKSCGILKNMVIDYRILLAGILDIRGRHSMIFYLSSFPISVLLSLDTEANKFYNSSNRLYDAALLTRCYTKHALRQVIDSKINHVRNIIKILIKGWTFMIYPEHSEINWYNQPYQIISRIVKY